MRFDLMSLEVHLRIKYNKFLLQTFSVWTHEMVFPEVLLERIVVHKVLLLPAPITAVANVAAFVLISTMCVQLIVSVEALATETAFRVSLEATLIDRARVIVTELLMLPEIGKREELVLVREDFLVPRTQITKLGQHMARMCTGHEGTVCTYHITLPCAVFV